MTLTQRLDQIYDLLYLLYETTWTLVDAERIDGETNLLLLESLINMSSDITDISSLLIAIEADLNSLIFHLAKFNDAVSVLVILLFCRFFYSLLRWLNNVH